MDKMFAQKKDLVISNLEILELNLNKCIDVGFPDPESEFYNQILGLIDEVNALDNITVLDEIIIKAKLVEIKIDTWLSSEGLSTLSLSW